MTVKIKPEYVKTEKPYSMPEDGIVEVEPDGYGYMYDKRVYVYPEHIDYIIVDGIPELKKDEWNR